MNSMPCACWPAGSPACVQVAPPLAGWQLQPPKKGTAVPSPAPLVSLTCVSPDDSEVPVGRAITAVSVADATAGGVVGDGLVGDGLGCGDGDCDGDCVAAACRDGAGGSWRALAGVLSLPVSVIASATPAVASSSAPDAATTATRRDRRAERRCARGGRPWPRPGSRAVCEATSAAVSLTGGMLAGALAGLRLPAVTAAGRCALSAR